MVLLDFARELRINVHMCLSLWVGNIKVSWIRIVKSDERKDTCSKGKFGLLVRSASVCISVTRLPEWPVYSEVKSRGSFLRKEMRILQDSLKQSFSVAKISRKGSIPPRQSSQFVGGHLRRASSRLCEWLCGVVSCQSPERALLSERAALFVFCADWHKWSILMMTTSKYFLKTRVDVRDGSCGVGRGYLWDTFPRLWVTLSAPSLLSTRVHFQSRLLCLTFKTPMHLKFFFNLDEKHVDTWGKQDGKCKEVLFI